LLLLTKTTLDVFIVRLTGAFELASCTSPMHAVIYNPAEPRLIATANAKEGVGLWDIRRPKT